MQSIHMGSLHLTDTEQLLVTIILTNNNLATQMHLFKCSHSGFYADTVTACICQKVVFILLQL